ncbi:MAG: glycosyltransferase family 2 protein, partial [Clostridia bacterium]|nr:glycosyltransferase family 2 protein [Clostridia bacterium]
MEKETIDVLVPVYNSAPYLEKCLTSILTQTYQDIRVVIVDDASTDGSGEIIKKLQDKFSNIEYYVRVGDKGISKARNFLLEKI